MRSSRGRLLACVVPLFAASGAWAQVKGAVSAVRVYRGQALVTRTVPLDAKAGAQELVVTDLPEQIRPDSLYATGDANLVIRAVRYRAKAVAEEPRAEVRQLDQEIQTAKDNLAKVQSDAQVAEQLGQYLTKLEGFVAPTAQAEITHGVLNSEQLIALTQFLFKQRADLAAQKVALAKAQREAQAQSAVLERRRAELASGGQRSAREAVLFVEAAAAKSSSIDLNYLVGGVGWVPAYVARLNAGRDKLILEYQGVVAQMTGEDWTNVSLSLSTSQPNMLACGPQIAPMWLTLTKPEDGADKAPAEADDYQNRRRDLQRQRGQGAAQRPASGSGGQPGGGFGNGGGFGANGFGRGVPRPVPPAAGDAPAGMGGMGGMGPGNAGGILQLPDGIESLVGYDLLSALIVVPAALPGQEQTEDELQANVLAAELQNLELSAADDAVRATRRLRPANNEGVAVEYPIAGKVSLASRSDQQTFRIAVLDLPAEAHYTASPLISDYVYQAVMTTNTTDTTLLPGPYNAYLDGAFAGRGNLPMVAKGEQVTLGFGTESQLRAVRELGDKLTEIKGGNKVLTLTYSLRLQNFMTKPAKVRLWDRMPQAPNDQVTVTLVDNGQPLSTDPLYVEQEKPRGLLRWDIELPANATGAKALSFTFKVKLEFDKQMAVGELPEQTIERMRKDIDTLKDLKR